MAAVQEAEGSHELARLRALVRCDERTEQEQIKPQQLLFPRRPAATRGPPGVLTCETRSLIGVMSISRRGSRCPGRTTVTAIYVFTGGGSRTFSSSPLGLSGNFQLN